MELESPDWERSPSLIEEAHTDPSTAPAVKQEVTTLVDVKMVDVKPEDTAATSKSILTSPLATASTTLPPPPKTPPVPPPSHRNRSIRSASAPEQHPPLTHPHLVQQPHSTSTTHSPPSTSPDSQTAMPWQKHAFQLFGPRPPLPGLILFFHFPHSTHSLSAPSARHFSTTMPCTTTSTATTFSTTSTLSTTAPHPRATSYRTTSPSSHRRYPSHRPQRRRGSRHEHDCTMTTCGCRLCITMSHLNTISKPLPPEKRQACILTISVLPCFLVSSASFTHRHATTLSMPLRIHRSHFERLASRRLHAMASHQPPAEGSDTSFWASVYTEEPANVLCGVLTDLNLHRFTLHQHLATNDALTATPLLHPPFQQALPSALHNHIQLYTTSLNQVNIHLRRALNALDAWTSPTEHLPSRPRHHS